MSKRIKVCDGGCGKTSVDNVIRKVTVAGQTYRFCAMCEYQHRYMTRQAREVERLTRRKEPAVKQKRKPERYEPALTFCAGVAVGATIMFFMLAIV